MKIKISIGKIHFFLENYFKRILTAILILLLCLNIFVYYKYVYSATITEVDLVVKKAVFNEEILNKVLEEIEEREENLIRVETSEYANPFN